MLHLHENVELVQGRKTVMEGVPRSTVNTGYFFITRNECKVSNPAIYKDTIRNEILFMDNPTISGTKVLIRQLPRTLISSDDFLDGFSYPPC